MILWFAGNVDPSTEGSDCCLVVPVVAQRLRKVTGTTEMFAHLSEEADILTPDLVERKLECYPHDSQVW
jgi:hypothetical protein